MSLKETEKVGPIANFIPPTPQNSQAENNSLYYARHEKKGD